MTYEEMALWQMENGDSDSALVYALLAVADELRRGTYLKATRLDGTDFWTCMGL